MGLTPTIPFMADGKRIDPPVSLPSEAKQRPAAVATPDPLDIILPDDPGLPASQQETQVRAQNTEGPGDFGAPTSNPAGTLDFEIDAGRSAIFLLIDGGNATGDIDTAGRVGIFGTGGRVTLTGTLVDDAGRPIADQRFSLVVDLVNPPPRSPASGPRNVRASFHTSEADGTFSPVR